MTTIPQSVVDEDHALEDAAQRTSEELARHRWHHTLDPDNPDRVSINAYAKAVGRNFSTIRTYAKGYEEWVSGNATNSLTDCIRKAGLSAEKQEVAEAVAKAEKTTVSSVSNRRGDQSLANVTAQAKERAERTGVTLGHAAKQIATTRRKIREAVKNEKTERQAKTDARILEAEGKLAAALRKIVEAVQVLEGVSLEHEDEMLSHLQDSVSNVRAVLDLLDLRIGGSVDVDWDAELASLVGEG